MARPKSKKRTPARPTAPGLVAVVVTAVAVAFGAVATAVSISSDDTPGAAAGAAASAATTSPAAGFAKGPSPAEINQAIVAYRAAVTSRLDRLVANTQLLRVAVRGGDRSLAQKRWLTAHLDYEVLGAAYGTFGDFDGSLNGRPNGLPAGAADPDFTGFLRLERDLWGSESLASLVPVTDQLDADAHALVAAFPSLPTAPIDLPLRVHEILENSLQFELTGSTDQGSHSNLATARANVEGTKLVLDALTPALSSHDPAMLTALQQDFRGLSDLLDAQHRPDGTWTPLSSLTLAQRQRIDGTAGAVLEDLADAAVFLGSQVESD